MSNHLGLSDMTVSEAEKSVPRGPGGKFMPGHHIGRPRGSKNSINSSVLDALGNLTSNAVAVLREKLIEKDLKAAFFVLTRFLPAERLIAADSTDAMAWADALAAGEITPTEAGKAASALKVIADTDEVRMLRDRLDEIEALIAATRK